MVNRLIVALVLVLLANTVTSAGELSVLPVLNAVTYEGPELKVVPDKYILAMVPDPAFQEELQLGRDPLFENSPRNDDSSSVKARAITAERAVDEQLETLQIITRTESKLRALKNAVANGGWYDPGVTAVTDNNGCPCPTYQPPVTRVINYSSTGSSATNYSSTGSSATNYSSTGSMGLNAAFYQQPVAPVLRVAVAPVRAISRVATGRSLQEEHDAQHNGYYGGPHWTWPGNLADHMAREHGGAGLNGSTRSYVGVSANCPGGYIDANGNQVCPRNGGLNVNVNSSFGGGGWYLGKNLGRRRNG